MTCAVRQRVPYAAPCPCSSVGERVIGNDEVSSSILLSGTIHRKTDMITPTQIRMARAALRWGVRDLAAKSGITANTVSRIENGHDAMQSTIDAIRVAFESAGITFIPGGCYASES